MKSNTPSLTKSLIIIMLMFLFGCGDSEVESEDSYTDETPAVVESTSPADGEGAIAGTSIVVTFSEAMDVTSISTNTGNTDCSGSIQVSKDNFTTCVQMDSSPIPNDVKTSFTLQPANKLDRDQTYKTKITIAARDAGQNAMSFDQVSNQGFTTLYVEELSTVHFHSCAKMNNQSAYCWGHGLGGSLGTGESVLIQPEPVSASLFSDVASILTFAYGTCSLNSNGQVHCVGDGSFGIYGTPLNNSLTPLHLEMLDSVIQMDSGEYSYCVIEDSGEVKCWGLNYYGQLGNGKYFQPEIMEPIPVQYEPTAVISLDSAVEFSTSIYHSCAITSDQSVKCWGKGDQGRLGNDSTADQASAVSVSNMDNATQLALGGSHSCTLLSDQTVKCWGKGDNGRLGNDSTSDQLSPVAVHNISTATQLTAGSGHTCALLEDQSIECWGRGYHGQIGNNSTSDQLIPVKVHSIDNAINISAGSNRTCAILSDHSVKCWGENFDFLSISTTPSNYLIPFEVPGL